MSCLGCPKPLFGFLENPKRLEVNIKYQLVVFFDTDRSAPLEKLVVFLSRNC